MLFKILTGDSSRISTDITPFHNGYAYLAPDNGGLYFDAEYNGEQRRIKIGSSDEKGETGKPGWYTTDENLPDTDVSIGFSISSLSPSDPLPEVNDYIFWTRTRSIYPITSISDGKAYVGTGITFKGDTGATGMQGVPGEDGLTPEITITEEQIGMTSGHRVAFDFPFSGKSFFVPDGKNGLAGPPGQQGPQGLRGIPGADGYSPAVSVKTIGSAVFDYSAAYDFDYPPSMQYDVYIFDGYDASPDEVIGKNLLWSGVIGSTIANQYVGKYFSEDGIEILGEIAQTIGSACSFYATDGFVQEGHRVTVTDKTHQSGQSFDVMDGADGYTPVRGTDYWTAADIAAIKGYVDDAILGGAW